MRDFHQRFQFEIASLGDIASVNEPQDDFPWAGKDWNHTSSLDVIILQQAISIVWGLLHPINFFILGI